MLPWMTAELEEVQQIFGDDPWPYGVEANRPTLQALVLVHCGADHHRRAGRRGRYVRPGGRRVLARRLDRASQHLDHPPDLRLRGNEGRRHGDGFPGEAVEHPFFHSALEYFQRAQAGLAL